MLRLNYGAGQTGTAEITVTATDAAGTTATDTFTAGVGALDVQIGDGGAKAGHLHRRRRHRRHRSRSRAAPASCASAAATCRRTSPRATPSSSATSPTSASTSPAPAPAARSPSRPSGGDGLITVNHLTSDGGMKSIAGKQVNITGPVTIAGNVAKADFADVANSIMTFGGSGGSLALSLRNAEGVEIVSQIPIKTLKAEPVHRPAGPTSARSPRPRSAASPSPATSTSGSTSPARSARVKIGGAVNSFLPWSVGGSAGKLTVGSFAEGFVADFLGPVSALTVNGDLHRRRQRGRAEEPHREGRLQRRQPDPHRHRHLARQGDGQRRDRLLPHPGRQRQHRRRHRRRDQLQHDLRRREHRRRHPAQRRRATSARPGRRSSR